MTDARAARTTPVSLARTPCPANHAANSLISCRSSSCSQNCVGLPCRPPGLTYLLRVPGCVGAIASSSSVGRKGWGSTAGGAVMRSAGSDPAVFAGCMWLCILVIRLSTTAFLGIVDPAETINAIETNEHSWIRIERKVKKCRAGALPDGLRYPEPAIHAPMHGCSIPVD